MHFAFTRSACTVMRRDCACNLALYCAPVRSVDCPMSKGGKPALPVLHLACSIHGVGYAYTRRDDAFWLALFNGAKRSMALQPQV